jgi:hypothetical protein
MHHPETRTQLKEILEMQIREKEQLKAGGV